MPPAADAVTLQINLSRGDLAYLSRTVPELVARHRGGVRTVLGVLDACRPQSAGRFDADERFPPAEFERGVADTLDAVHDLKRAGILDELVVLRPGDEQVAALRREYYGSAVRPHETHDYLGHGLISYAAGFGLPETRYVLHYDADMMLHQAAGYDWVAEALGRLAAEPRAVAAVCRKAPPSGPDRPDEFAEYWRPLERGDGFVLHDWFSTRCLLLDRDRLAPYLPLTGGRAAAECRLRKWLNLRHPVPPEALLHRRVGRAGGRCLALTAEKAWLLHPVHKDAQFLRQLPRILEAVRSGEVPPAQRGRNDVLPSAWDQSGPVAEAAPAVDAT
ncbi:hypothetical protein [Alienimonas sp. DA493]|uniref:hypothetical protein n=1 Tax=Alienimonas sp. DA493 TaxID=3373605 RepID=UPI003754E0AF